MKTCIIGGANVDITATTLKSFVPNDSNPGTVRLSSGGVARNIAHNLALMGNEIVFLTFFAGDTFGWFTADSCRKANIDISLCDTAPLGSRSIFLSINNEDGELIGGVSDMVTADSITPVWLASKLSKIENVDVFVADANLSVDSLAYLIDLVDEPLFIDAVSGAKAPKIKKAMALSKRKRVFTVKCNQMEYECLKDVKGITRLYVSRGNDGLDVIENGKLTHFPSLPCKVENATGAGDALMAGIVHAGPNASIEEAASMGLKCAKITCECPDTVNKQLKQLYEQIS